MDKILKRMPGAEDMASPSASVVLEINMKHAIADKLKSLYSLGESETLKNYARVLYGTASLVSGVSLENPSEFASLVSSIII